jgi:hypothetical protein
MTLVKSILNEIMFNSQISDDLKLSMGGKMAVGGKPNNGLFIPSLSVTAGNDKDRRLFVSWIGHFTFKQERNINESHLHAAVEVVYNDLDNFLNLNKNHFGIVKLASLESWPNIQSELHSILKKLYNT